MDAEQRALLPCPFCGSPRVSRLGRCIECHDCHASGPERTQRDECEQAWNTRALTQAQPGWRGIESAPRDGTMVLTWHSMGGNGAVVNNPTSAYYGKPGWCRIQGMLGGNVWPGDMLDTGRATHWMPLPAAPAPQQGEG